MAKIVECVPNFSDGRNKDIIDAIAQAIASVDDVTLLDVDPGESTNRTVYTFVGSPESVVEGALNGARIAMQAINMTRHQGIEQTRVCLLVERRGSKVICRGSKVIRRGSQIS